MVQQRYRVIYSLLGGYHYVVDGHGGRIVSEPYVTQAEAEQEAARLNSEVPAHWPYVASWPGLTVSRRST